ncbi:MAG: acyl-CoA/acyl-ACP dehydrogenase [Deltaproteobacteria bacterium]|nr:acyl-CoA/acyl-ACP dehydrogenase [Deltaproteobacteria bacterium]
MSLFDMDVIGSQETKAMLKEVARFAAKIMRPAGIELDSLDGVADIFKKESVFWEVWKGYRKLDLHLNGIPEALGGMGEPDWLASILLAERLGAADIGLALSLNASDAAFKCMALFKTPAADKLAGAYCADRDCAMIGALSATCGLDDPDAETGITAEQKGAGWVLNGGEPKVTNGAIATHAVFAVTVREQDGQDGRGFCVVPLGEKGVTVGPSRKRPGQRTLNQAGIRLKDVKIPKGLCAVMGQKEMEEARRKRASGEIRFVSAVYTGAAMGAWEEAAKYAKGRIQGGQPIYFHKNIQLQFFNMLKNLEAARASIRRTAMYQANSASPAPAVFGAAAKCLAAETATLVASEAIQIFGGYGLTKEFPAEKIWRDARIGMIEHGINEDLALHAMAAL